jgi:hypothetical protein
MTFPETIFPYPDTNDYFEPIIDVSSLGCELALLTLNITRGEFNAMSELEIRRFCSNIGNDRKERVALQILLSYKKRIHPDTYQHSNDSPFFKN